MALTHFLNKSPAKFACEEISKPRSLTWTLSCSPLYSILDHIAEDVSSICIALPTFSFIIILLRSNGVGDCHIAVSHLKGVISREVNKGDSCSPFVFRIVERCLSARSLPLKCPTTNLTTCITTLHDPPLNLTNSNIQPTRTGHPCFHPQLRPPFAFSSLSFRGVTSLFFSFLLFSPLLLREELPLS